MKLLLSFPRISDFFFTEKHTVLSSEKSFMNITFLLNFLINSKQLMIFTINANVLSSKKLFMNIRFHKNSLINTDIFNFSNVLFSHTDIPAADEINSEINYSQEGKHISASLTFQNIYPLPECMLSIGVCLRKNSWKPEFVSSFNMGNIIFVKKLS